jgi:hypothetical protein
MPFPPNSTERSQQRWAKERAELNRFRDMMADISRRNRENYERIVPPKTSQTYLKFADYVASAIFSVG